MKNRLDYNGYIIYKEEFLIWVNEFGVLKGWEFEFDFIPFNKNKPNDSLSHVQCYTDDKLAFVTVNENWRDTKITDYSIRKTAFHESVEVLFDPLESLITTKKNKGRGRIEVHTLIKLLENTLFNESYIKRFGKIDHHYLSTRINVINDID